MQIIDHATSPEFCAAFRDWLQTRPLFYGWKGHKDSAGVFWHSNFVLPGTYENHYDPAAVEPDKTFAKLMAQPSPLAAVAKAVSDQFFNGHALTRVWVNVQSFGDESAVHRDFPIKFAGQAKSVVWYPVEAWEENWGGDFCTFDEAGEIDRAVLIKPDRMVVMDGTTRHAARPISRYTNTLRIAVAFGLETQESN